ncbi:hypothetical protein PAAG_11109 [Paracoccidioides lutzii Pb01]|uniref:Zn(2)-C6 fungal-type domain-containing protein n=1 Tax=Paracoccidioides lutzii (strain ATCC MYA-826 / Pb01) TaxID=502779 RepID=A0A0A2V7X0_PARBA|nr:hypothetical protein PAAG_11109 [Paracoccidioides lutzii Pb01]KGQ02155.1 hypothetical protein PAAG_11109 [Paracoccidioides lutzii Pb01]
MPFPSRGCRTCKRRRVKCDEARPFCSRCQKANLTCKQVENSNFIFLNENEFVIGRLKRPRGPNVRARSESKAGERVESTPSKNKTKGLHGSSGNAVEDLVRRALEPQLNITPTHEVSLDQYAVFYYYRNFLQMEHIIPGIVDSHLNYVMAGCCFSQPQSVLGHAIFAVSYATFARAEKSYSALTRAATTYLKALMKTKMSLYNASYAKDDEVLLAVMLLSFYENTAMDSRAPPISGLVLLNLVSRIFAHHDGALALLDLRRKQSQRTKCGLGLDKVVRRQLLRSLLLRSSAPPSWLADGAEYGEVGSLLELDRCTVEVSKIRERAKNLLLLSPKFSPVDWYGGTTILNQLLEDAWATDGLLVSWTNNLPMQYLYSTIAIQNNWSRIKLFDPTAVHIYPTVGQAAMWNRYRVIRLALNEVILKILSILDEITNSVGTTESLAAAVKLTIKRMADDLCRSVPYMLGIFEAMAADGRDAAVITNVPTSGKITVKATTGALLCWPLAMTAMMCAIIPDKNLQYLRICMLEVSEVVHDGVLERMAAAFPQGPTPVGGR